MDDMARLSGCGGEAAAAVSAKIQVKIEDASALLKPAKSECRMKSVWSSTKRITVGKTFLNTSSMWKKYRIGNACVCIDSKVYSYLNTWMTYEWLEGSKTSTLCGRNWWNSLIWRVDIISWPRAHGRVLCVLWKSNIRSHKLDVESQTSFSRSSSESEVIL